MPGDAHLREDSSDPTVTVDDDGRALDPHVIAAVERFLLPDAELIGERVLLVRQQPEGQCMLLLELAV